MEEKSDLSDSEVLICVGLPHTNMSRVYSQC